MRPSLLSDFYVECPGGGRLVFAPVPAPWPADRYLHAARALDAVKATAGWEPTAMKPDGTPRPPRKLPKRYVNLLRDIRAAVDWYGGAEGGRIWLEAPQSQPQADARARALIELEHLLSFWGAAADGSTEDVRAEACYEIAMGDEPLDEGPVAIILSYLQKEDHEN